ncbi:MAG: molybdopterin-guanine dinucleotide biosynthesis protein B [Candidatus Puniceispirillaceae bacterium]
MSTNPRNRAGHDQPCLDEMIRRHGSVIGLAAFSGSGKTTLAEKLIAGLVSHGMDVATVKHAHHAFDADTPGKDSYRHRAAGARQVAVSSPARSVLFTENLSGPERSLADLLAAIAPADIVIVEGFKKSSIPKIEIHRAELAHPFLFADDPLIIAVASNDPASLPASAPFALDLDQPDNIVDFIIQRHRQQSGAAAS